MHKTKYVQTRIHKNCNQNQNCLSLHLKWFRGAERTSNGIEPSDGDT